MAVQVKTNVLMMKNEQGEYEDVMNAISGGTGTVTTDKTLTQENVPADAKAVGDRFVPYDSIEQTTTTYDSSTDWQVGTDILIGQTMHIESDSTTTETMAVIHGVEFIEGVPSPTIQFVHGIEQMENGYDLLITDNMINIEIQGAEYSVTYGMKGYEVLAQVKDDVSELQDNKMERYVIRLVKISNNTYKMTSLDDEDLTFEEVYNTTKKLNEYVVVLYGNSKLRPQYVSENEMMFVGIDRSTESKILRILYTPTRLTYETFKLAEYTDLNSYVKTVNNVAPTSNGNVSLNIPQLDTTLTVSGKASDSKAVGDKINELKDNVAISSSTQPTEPMNKIWLDESTEEIITVPDIDEFNEVKTKVDVDSARIDTIVSSATVDSEVQDIRVGADGTTYTSAGQAVREQVSQLSESITEINRDLSEVLDYEESTLDGVRTVRKYINWRKVVADVANDSYYVVAYDVSNIDSIVINGSASNENYLYIITDASGTTIAYPEPNNTGKVKSYNNIDIEIPESSKMLYVSGFVGSDYTQVSANVNGKAYVVGLPECINKVADLESIVEKVVNKTEMLSVVDTARKYLKWNKTIADISNDEYHVSTISVNSGDTLHIVGAVNQDNYKYMFFDANDQFVSGETGTSGTVKFEKTLTVPNNATKLYIQTIVSINKTHAVVEKIINYKNKTDKWDGYKWVCLGDSLTADNSASNKHYFDFISDRTGITTINMGVGGTGYKWKDVANEAFYQRAETIPNCDIVTIFGSGNDLRSELVLGTYTDRSTDTVCGCVNKTIDVILSNHPYVKVGIISPTPWANYPTTAVNNKMETFTELLKQIAKYRGIPFLDMYHESCMRPEDTRFAGEYYSEDIIDGYSDAVHPNNKGQHFMYPKFYQFIREMIG